MFSGIIELGEKKQRFTWVKCMQHNLAFWKCGYDRLDLSRVYPACGPMKAPTPGSWKQKRMDGCVVFPCYSFWSKVSFGKSWSKLRSTLEQVSDQLWITSLQRCATRSAWQCDVYQLRWWYSLNTLSGTFLACHSSQEDRVWSKLKGTVSIGSTAGPASSWSP